MADSQVRRMDEIEIFRQKAFALSRNDRLGRLLMKTFDIMQTVVKDGPKAKVLQFEVESLKEEHSNAINADSNQNDIYRSLCYGLSESIGSMIESIQERSQEATTIHTHMDQGNGVLMEASRVEQASFDQDFLTAVPKTEPTESVFLSENNLEILKMQSNSEILSDHTQTPLSFGVTAFGAVSAPDSSDNAMIDSDLIKEEDDIDLGTLTYAEDGINDHGVMDVKDDSMGADCFTQEAGNDQLNGSSNENTEPTVHESGIADGAGKAIKPYKCAYCISVFDRKSQMAMHIMETHADKLCSKSHACSYCNTIINGESWVLKPHRRIHTGDQPFACELCPRKFQRNGEFAIHLRSAHGEKPFQCMHCGEEFGLKSEMVNHEMDTHREKKRSKSHSCSYCNKIINGPSSVLKRHERIHTGEKPFACTMCPRKFARNGDFVMHLRSNHGEKPYKCSECEASFGRRAEMRQHKNEEHSGKATA